MTTLDTAVDEILDGIRNALEAAANETGGELNEIQAVVWGDRARPLPEMPAIFLIPPAEATSEALEYGREEHWTMDVSIAVLVVSDDPEDGSRTALRLAARARAAALTVRREIDCIYDMASRSIGPRARNSATKPNLYWTDAVVRVVFDVTD